MTTSATRRFIALIGEDRLHWGAMQTDPLHQRVPEPYHVGKEAFIMSILFPDEVCWCPYLPGSQHAGAYQSGAAIECTDLQDVVRIML